MRQLNAKGSAGLYFGQGPLNLMEQDELMEQAELAHPIIAASVDLLKSVTSADHS